MADTKNYMAENDPSKNQKITIKLIEAFDTTLSNYWRCRNDEPRTHFGMSKRDKLEATKILRSIIREPTAYDIRTLSPTLLKAWSKGRLGRIVIPHFISVWKLPYKDDVLSFIEAIQAFRNQQAPTLAPAAAPSTNAPPKPAAPQ